MVALKKIQDFLNSPKSWRKDITVNRRRDDIQRMFHEIVNNSLEKHFLNCVKKHWRAPAEPSSPIAIVAVAILSSYLNKLNKDDEVILPEYIEAWPRQASRGRVKPYDGGVSDRAAAAADATGRDWKEWTDGVFEY